MNPIFLRNRRPSAGVGTFGRTLLPVALVLATFGGSLPFPKAPAWTEARLDDRLVQAIAESPSADMVALVSYEGALSNQDAQRIRDVGLRPVRYFPDFGVFAVAGPAHRMPRLLDMPAVTYMVPDHPLEFDLDTATVATRAREAWDSKSTSLTPALKDGAVVDGSGIGIAVVDGAFDGLHPDLAPGVIMVKRNACATPVCLADFTIDNGIPCDELLVDTIEPASPATFHGTATAGVAAGRGVASDGRFTGAAPGASLFLFATGLLPLNALPATILRAEEVLGWIHCHHNLVSPRIRIVSNSWGSPGEYNGHHPINKAVNKLIADGLVVVFSAGNRGGSGGVNEVNTYAKNPAPGVIGVGGTDDQGAAGRLLLYPNTSRGRSNETNKHNWPDVSAPAGKITAPGYFTPLCGTPCLDAQNSGTYQVLNGTSFAAPHVAGIVALLLQANPTLTPGQVEDILEDTAVPFPVEGGYVDDAANPSTGINYASGHGLVDAVAALNDPRVGAVGGSALPQVSQAPHVYLVGDMPSRSLDGQAVWPVRWTVPRGAEVVLAEIRLASGDSGLWPLQPGQAARFRLDCAWGLTNAAASLDVHPGEPGLSMEAAVAFQRPLESGAQTCRVEPQIDFGSGYQSYDAFSVRVI